MYNETLKEKKSVPYVHLVPSLPFVLPEGCKCRCGLCLNRILSKTPGGKKTTPGHFWRERYLKKLEYTVRLYNVV